MSGRSEGETTGKGTGRLGLTELEQAAGDLLREIAAYLDAKIEAATLHEAVEAARSLIRDVAWDEDDSLDRQAANFSDLLDELADATSFEQGHTEAVRLVQAMLENGLEDTDESEEWAQLVQMRGPIEALWRYECEDCGFGFPVCGMSAFAEMFNGVCEACGAIGFFSTSDERLAELQARYDEEHGQGWSEDRERERQFWEDVSEALPRCGCGNAYEFYFAHQAPFAVADEFCPKCGSADVEAERISRYAYFLEHEFVIHH
ncbi:MAG: hypothetical protein ACE5O2_06405 [Armatimonadota bacterium]